MTASQMKQNTANRRSVRFLIFDVPPEGANLWFDLSNVVLFVGAVLVALGTYGTIKFAAIKERYSDERIAVNEVETKRAVADSDAAKEGTAKANERIAELTAQAETARKETAEATLQLEQLRTLAGPRTLNHEIFAKEIAGKPKAPVEIWYLPDASDSWQFCLHLDVALHEAGWQVSQPIPIPAPPPNSFWKDLPRAMAAGGQPAGITIVGADMADMDSDPAFKALFEALAKSTKFGMYGSGGSQAMPVPKGTLRVVVAAKTDPMFMKPEPSATQNK